MAKQKYRITNWSEYNAALKKRGSLAVWIEEGFENIWYATGVSDSAKRGRPLLYSDACIKLMATIRHLFKLALRQLEGFLTSLFTMLKIELRVPEFSRLSRRMSEALSSSSYPSPQEPIHLVIDSSGLKVYGEKEWIKTKHGKEYFRRVWRKIHIGVVRSSKMTTHKTDDRACFPTLIDQVGSSLINETLADSGYDSHNSYHQCNERNIVPIIPPPKNAKMSCRKTSSLERNKTVQYIKEKGLAAWKYKNDYGRRNRVENTFYRIKTIFGRQFMSRAWKNQEAETNIICHLLNKMTSLGMPSSVKAA
jgi:hypothetical protein